MAAGVSVGVAINKTVGCNDDLTFSFADFATRENKGNRLLSGQKKKPSRQKPVIDKDTKGARSRGKKVSAIQIGRASVTGNCIFSFLEFWVFTRKDERT